MDEVAWFWAMVCQAALAASLQTHVAFVAEELELEIDLDPDLTAMAERIARA